MSQRITLQYSIPLETLEDEVMRLLSNAYDVLAVIGNSPHHDTQSTPLTLQTLQHLEELRTQLADVDLRLSDISGMINGYLDYEVKRRGPQTTEPSLEGGSMAQLDALTKKLEQFKEDNDNSTQGSTS